MKSNFSNSKFSGDQSPGLCSVNNALKFSTSWLWTRSGLSLLFLVCVVTTLRSQQTNDEMSVQMSNLIRTWGAQHTNDMSAGYPYTNYLGKLLVTVGPGTVWSNAAKHPFLLRRCFLTSGTNAAPADPSESGTAPVKLAEFPAGTHVKLEAVKMLSEFDHEEDLALATLSFTNGTSIRFQSLWREFDPSPDEDSNFELGEFPSTRIDFFREGEVPKRKYQVLSEEISSSNVRLKERGLLIKYFDEHKGDQGVDGLMYMPSSILSTNSFESTYTLRAIHYVE